MPEKKSFAVKVAGVPGPAFNQELELTVPTLEEARLGKRPCFAGKLAQPIKGLKQGARLNLHSDDMQLEGHVVIGEDGVSFKSDGAFVFGGKAHW